MNCKSLSASAYSAFDYCEWKWFLVYTLGFEDMSGGAALLGQLCHSIFESMSLAAMSGASVDNDVFNPEKQWDNWLELYKIKSPKVMSEIKKEKIQKIRKGYLSVFNSEYSPITNKTIAAEQYFKLPIEEERFRFRNQDKEEYFTVRGVIDRVDNISNNHVEIIDYKSGSRQSFGSDSKEKKNNETLKNDIQPRLYHLAGKQLYPNASDFLVTFVYFCDGGPVSIPFCDDDIADTKDMIYNQMRRISENINPQRNKTWRCKYCYFGDETTGICSRVWDEKNKTDIDFIQEKYKVINAKDK